MEKRVASSTVGSSSNRKGSGRADEFFGRAEKCFGSENEALEEREKALDYGACAVCLKVNEHRSGNCPYLIEVPEGATLGPDYALVCKCCNDVGAHPGKTYRARAMRKFCVFCAWEPHWTEECPVFSPTSDYYPLARSGDSIPEGSTSFRLLP